MNKKIKNLRKKENTICEDIFELFEKRRTDRLPFELKWRLNSDFIEGNQFSYIDSGNKDIMEVDNVKWWQEREVFNQIAPIYETRLAKLSQMHFVLDIRPATNEQSDIKNARMCKRILESIENEVNMKNLQKKANLWSEKTGSAIWGIFWDKNAGKTIGYKEITVEDENKKKVKREIPIKEGAIRYEVIPPYEIFPSNIYANSVEELDYLIRVKVMSVREIEKKYGKSVEGYENDVVSYTSLKSNVGGIGQKGHGYGKTTLELDHSAQVLSYFEKPSNVYPKGRYIVCTKDEILYEGELPYINADNDEREIPFVIQKSIDTGNFFGESIITRLIPLQRRYNNIKNRKQEYLNRVSIGQISYEKGSIDEDEAEDVGLAPGAIFKRRQGTKVPEYIKTPSLPYTITDDEKTTESLFLTLSGTSEISRNSTTPLAVTSGVALSLLKEQDDIRLNLCLENIYDTRIKIAKMTLKMFKSTINSPRLARFVGKSGAIESFYFTGNDISSTDIYIDSTTLLSQSTSVRREMVLTLLDKGLFNDPETGKISKETLIKIFEMVELGNWEDYAESIDPHVSKAKRENTLIINQKEPIFKEYDDHEIHLKEHTSFLISEECEGEIINNPKLEEAFISHIDKHKNSLIEEV